MLITTKTNTEVNMSYKHLTLNERNKIDDLSKNLMEINYRTRNCLNSQTPFKLFLHELSLIYLLQYYL